MSRMRDAIRSGWKGSEVLRFLTGGGEHDRTAGDFPNAQRRTTTGVAVEFGEHHAVEADALVEGGRGVHRVLADHRVDDEQDLVRRHRVADVAGLIHQLLVDGQPTRGVDDHDVVTGVLRVLHTVARHGDRIADAVARLRREDADADPLGHHRQADPPRSGAAGRPPPAADGAPARAASGRLARQRRLAGPCRPTSMSVVGGLWHSAGVGSRRRGS